MALLLPGETVARPHLFPPALRTAVLLRQGDPQFLHSAEKRGLVDAELLRRRQAVEGVAFEGGADSLGVENIGGGPRMGIQAPRRAGGLQLPGQVFDADAPFVTKDEGALDDIFKLADVSRPIVSHEKR